MANSKFSYVRAFESDDKLPPDQWIVMTVRQVCDRPVNPFLASTALRDGYSRLMCAATEEVMQNYKDLKIGYTQFDTVDFVFIKNVWVYQRRRYKLMTYLVSAMTSAFIRHWDEHFPGVDMEEMPIFEGKIHLLPHDQLLRDLLTQHQANHHLCNLTNTLQIAIGGQLNTNDNNKNSLISKCVSFKNHCESSANQQSESVDATLPFISPPMKLAEVPSNKAESFYNEILFSRFGINYNNESKVLRKGCSYIRQTVQIPVTTQSGVRSSRRVSKVVEQIVDFKEDSFWNDVNRISVEKTKYNVKCSNLPKFFIDDRILPHSWIVVRVDGKAFHKLAQVHNFIKPNDRLAIDLMNKAACDVMKTMPDIIISFGESDEFSFVFNRYRKTYQSSPDLRWSNILVSRCVSIFTASYVDNWNKIFKIDHKVTTKLVDDNAQPCLIIDDYKIEFGYGHYEEMPIIQENSDKQIKLPSFADNEEINVRCINVALPSGPLSDDSSTESFEDCLIASNIDHEAAAQDTTVPITTTDDDTSDKMSEPVTLTSDITNSSDHSSNSAINNKRLPLQYSPSFDGRIVLYPTNSCLRDYLSWRQVDCHINNMYNTTFWNLIQVEGHSNSQAEQILNGTFSVDKRNILSRMGVDYNNEPAIHRKGSVIFRRKLVTETESDSSVFNAAKSITHSSTPSKYNGNSKKEVLTKGQDMRPQRHSRVPYKEKLWWNPDCVTAKIEKLKIRTICQLDPSPENLELLKKSHLEIKKVVRTAKKEYKNKTSLVNVAEPTLNYTAETTVTGTAEKTDNYGAEVTLNGTAETTINVTAEKTVNGAAETTINVTAEKTVNGAAEVTVNGTAETAINVTAEKTVNGAAEVTVNGTAETAINVTAEKTVNGTAETTINGTAENKATITLSPENFNTITSTIASAITTGDRVSSSLSANASLCTLIPNNSTIQDADLASKIAKIKFKHNPLDDYNIWWNDECRYAKLLRNQAKRKMNKNPSQANQENFDRVKTEYFNIVKKSKKKYREKVESELSTSGTLGIPNSGNVATLAVASSLVSNDANGGMKDPAKDTKAIESNKLVDLLCIGQDKEAKTGEEACGSNSTILETLTRAKLQYSQDLEKLCAGAFGKDDSLHTQSSAVTTAAPSPISDYDTSSYQVLFDNIVLCHSDIIGDTFWLLHPYLLGSEKSSMQFKED